MAVRLSQAFSILVLICWLGVPAWAGERSVRGAARGQMAAETSTTQDSIDPADDPWLRQVGPAVAEPVYVSREQVLNSWQNASPSPRARAIAVRRVRLELGLGDLSAPAVALLRSAADEEPEIHAQLARELAPGLPAIQMANAAAFWQIGESGASFRSVLDAVVAAATHLEVQLWLIENVSLLLVMVVLGTSLAFMLLAALMVFPHAAHDLGDLLSGQTPAFARSAALAALVLVPLALGEGIVGLALAVFTVAFAYGKSGQRNALAMAAALLVIGLHPLARLASVTTVLLDQDPVARSVLAVGNGIATQADIERLREASVEDLLAAHALAYHARRFGLEDEARARLDDIGTNFAAEPVMLVNRGNIELRGGRTEEAIGYYERAAALIDSPILLFDLSQAYATAFQMELYEVTLSQAQSLGDDEVSALLSLDGAKVVADLGLPFGRLQDRLITLALSQEPHATVARVLAPGHLGDRWFITASAFALVVLFCLLFADRFDHSSVCTRCGHRICTRCEETVWSEDVCEDCHHLFRNSGATDPSLRRARLQTLSKREVKLDRIWLAAALLVPGAAGFASKRPDLAMFGLLLFGWTSVWIAWPRGVFADPLLLGSAAWLCLAIPGALSMLAYIGVVTVSLIARSNR